MKINKLFFRTLPLSAALLIFTALAQGKTPTRQVFKTDGGVYTFTIDTSDNPDLSDWARDTLAPVIKEWYPKIVGLLSYPGFAAPREFSITYYNPATWRKTHPGGFAGAQTSGNRIRCGGSNRSVNVVIHEMVHVVQSGRSDTRSTRGDKAHWLTEGMAVYFASYIYDPEKHGDTITRNNINIARYDGSYGFSASFLNWVATNRDKDIIRHVFEAKNKGGYNDDLWKKWTGHTLQELNDEWKADLRKQLFKN